jgi:hypothetical protein
VVLQNVIRSEDEADLNKRKFLVQLIYYVSCAAVGFFSRDILFNGSADRRFVLYNVMKELRKDMSRSDIEGIVNRHATPFVERHESNDTLALSVWLSAMKALTLKINFAEQKLARAEFVGIDSPSDIPRDAPRPIF